MEPFSHISALVCCNNIPSLCFHVDTACVALFIHHPSPWNLACMLIFFECVGIATCTPGRLIALWFLFLFSYLKSRQRMHAGPLSLSINSVNHTSVCTMTHLRTVQIQRGQKAAKSLASTVKPKDTVEITLKQCKPTGNINPPLNIYVMGGKKTLLNPNRAKSLLVSADGSWWKEGVRKTPPQCLSCSLKPKANKRTWRSAAKMEEGRGRT